jgi:hypothetical protein
MEMYRKTLEILKDLLQKSDNGHWAQWLDRDIVEWDSLKSTTHHRSAFGGMGSINDLWVGGNGKIGTWNNNLFDLLKSISWTFATKKKIQFPTSTIGIIEGTICRNCSYSEISENGIEYYISNKHLPKIISTLLPTDKYIDLKNIEIFVDETEINIDRQKLISALTELKINFSQTNCWLKTCPSCNGNDTCVYRWDVTNKDDRIILTQSKNNLELKTEMNKTTWWKRIMGIS